MEGLGGTRNVSEKGVGGSRRRVSEKGVVTLHDKEETRWENGRRKGDDRCRAGTAGTCPGYDA